MAISNAMRGGRADDHDADDDEQYHDNGDHYPYTDPCSSNKAAPSGVKGW